MPPLRSKLKAALVHDWLTGMRGGEKVLLSLARLFPDAPIFTLLHVRGSVAPELEARDIRTTFVQHLPAVETHYRRYLPLFPAAAASIDLSDFDLVISSSHCVAKGVRVRPGARHLCYCHTPMRYVWDRYDDYFGPGRVSGLTQAVIPTVAEALRAWDVATAGGVHRYAANSAYVAGRIRRYYGREAVVIPPPVDTEFFTPDGRPGGDYDLVVSALVPYKRIELILDAYRSGPRPLKVVGGGPDAARLRALAGRGTEMLGPVDDVALRDLYRGCRAVVMASVEDFGIVPLEAMACGRPAVVFAEGGGRETVLPGQTGVLFQQPTGASLRAAVDSLEGLRFNTTTLRSHAEAYSRQVFEARFRAFVEEALADGFAPLAHMVKFQTRIMVGVFVLVDILSTVLAWVFAYFLRFHSDLVLEALPASKGVPAFSRYLVLIPVIVVLWPAVLYFHGLYQLKRGRSRIDEFFAILFSVLIGTALLLGATLYVRVYYKFQPDVAPLWEYSQAVMALFVVLDVLALNSGRSALRAYLKRMWTAGYNVRRVLVAGAGELGQQVAETILAHRELGFRLVGFVDDSAPAVKERGGIPVLGTLDQATQVAAAHHADQLYVALPLEEHAKLLRLIKNVSNECVDIKVVPDLVQYATIKAVLEDLDGIPIISLSEVPLRGWNSMVKRVMDVIVGSTILVVLTPFFLLLAALIKWKGGRGPILLRQERMTLDGKTFQIYKFRTMVHNAEENTGPIWASPEDPRRTGIGIWLRRFNLDEFPQLLNVVLGDMSLVGPRPERPPFVQQFKEHIPQYMLRHRVKSGITGWAQVNGWRGNTSIEKRIEYDLYYIENWSLLLDIKILILTLFRGFGQKHAY